MAETIPTESEGIGTRPSPILVAKDDSGHSDAARPWVSAYLASRHEQDET
jgi:hypothetical protein